VVEAAVIPHGAVEGAFAGMPEGGVAEIMGERQRFGEVLIKSQRPRDGSRDLRHLERVGEPGAVVVAFVFEKYLRLVLQAPEGG
jgi:hypothetical protein